MATDPLLCHLSPGTIVRLSTSGDFNFEQGEKEWSLRAAEGNVKVNEWLGEVEGWNREWRRTYRESKDVGDGYLPPADRFGKGRETGMGRIGDEDEGPILDGSKPVRRRLFSEDNGTGGSGAVIVKDDTPGVEKIGAKQEREEKKGEEDTELEEVVEYWGSLKRSIVERYEARIKVIKSEIEKLDVDGFKDRVLCESGPSLPSSLTHKMLTAGLISLSCQRS